MLKITSESTTDSTTVVLRLEGDVTIETVSELRDAIMEAFGSAAQIRINCEAVSRIDFFGVQILCSAHRTSVVKKKLLTWDKTRSASLDGVMSSTGFSRHCGCSLCPAGIDCMWI